MDDFMSMEALVAADSATDYSDDDIEESGEDCSDDDGVGVSEKEAVSKFKDLWPSADRVLPTSEQVENFCDEDRDDENERWVNGKYRRSNELATVLSCPGCFSTVCFEGMVKSAKEKTVYLAHEYDLCTVTDDVIKCGQCSSIVGKFIDKENVEFNQVLPSA